MRITDVHLWTHWTSPLHCTLEIAGIHIGLHWCLPWAYAISKASALPWRLWVYSEAHGSDSFYWRVLGLEINIPLDQS